jgi:hypothetical protein
MTKYTFRASSFTLGGTIRTPRGRIVGRVVRRERGLEAYAVPGATGEQIEAVMDALDAMRRSEGFSPILEQVA